MHNTQPELVIQHYTAAKTPSETYVAAEGLICAGTWGIGRLREIGLARLSVLYLKLLQLQEKMSLLVDDVGLVYIWNIP